MSTYRPRHSVLNLFDPLASTSTPDRDAPSPDSDKENSSPPVGDCSMTAAFFGRSYKPSQPAPVAPKRRLIDIGDITVDDASMHMMLTDEEELEDLNDDENETLTFFRPASTPARPVDKVAEPATPSASTSRTPLGELALERDLTPVARTKMYRRTALPPSSLAAPEIVISPPRGDSSITSVINAVNSSGTSFAEFGPTDGNRSLDLLPEDLNDENDNVAFDNTQMPHITVSSPDSLADSLSMMNLETPTGSLLTDTTRPFGITPTLPPSNTTSSQPPHRLRPNPPKTSSHDPNRRSIDLYSSFQLQLQSEDASFDLLNDKISFLASGSGMDSFMNAMEGDDSFDMDIEEANMESALEKMRLEDAVIKKHDNVSSPTAIEPLAIGESEPFPKPIEELPNNSTPETKPAEKRSLRKRLSFSYNSGPNSPASPTFASGFTKTFTKKSPSPAISPMQSPRASVFTAPPTLVPQSTISTPLASARDSIMPPPAVPALRIVKRTTRFGHEKFSSSGSASSTEAPSAPETLPTSSTAPQRLVPVTFSAGSQVVRLASAGSTARASGPSRVTPAQPPIAPPPPNKFGTGPRRVPIADRQPIAANGKVGVVPTSTTGPRRVQITAPAVIAPASAAEPVVNKLPTVSGLRAPAKYGAGIGTVSALPRPPSRLPAPATSGIGKMRTVSSTNEAGSGVAAPGKGIPVRRMMYGGQ